MGIILRNDSKIIFFLKGADVVLSRLMNKKSQLFVQEESGNLSREGLRTMVLCFK